MKTLHWLFSICAVIASLCFAVQAAYGLPTSWCACVWPIIAIAGFALYHAETQ